MKYHLEDVRPIKEITCQLGPKYQIWVELLLYSMFVRESQCVISTIEVFVGLQKPLSGMLFLPDV
jgi:hypothetical protein